MTRRRREDGACVVGLTLAAPVGGRRSAVYAGQMGYGSLERVVTDACRELLSGAPDLAGLALCTDDDGRTLFPVGCSVGFVESHDYPHVLFEPTEWESPFADALPSEVIGTLSSLHQLGDERHVERLFEALTRVLKSLREDGVVTEGVFLSVLSTDPCEWTDELEDRSITQLNDPALVERRRRWAASFE